MIYLQIVMIDIVFENFTQLQTVKPIHKTVIVYRLVTVGYFFSFILRF